MNLIEPIKPVAGHLWDGILPALKSLRFSVVTVATTVLGFMAADASQPLQSPQTSMVYLQHHWWGILIGAFILPAIRGTQGTVASVKNGSPTPPAAPGP